MSKLDTLVWTATTVLLLVMLYGAPDFYLAAMMLLVFPLIILLNCFGVAEALLYGQPIVTAAIVWTVHQLSTYTFFKPLDICFWESLDLLPYHYGWTSHGFCD
jgi:hypothetical protein